MAKSALPLRGIVVFEAVARQGSFHAAAHELNLTPSAVSHQIRLLEEVLGVALFERVGRGVTITPVGAEYARSVRPSIHRLHVATRDIMAFGRTSGTLDVVRIDTPASFARCWILPHLAEFITRYPGVDIRLNSQETQHSDAPADLRIVYGEARRWQDKASLFLPEIIQPLCAPSLLAKDAIVSPRHLLRQTLISTQRNSLSWEDWFQMQGLEIVREDVRTIQLDPSHVAIEAAVKGMGVILESSILTQHEMAAGSLASPFPNLSVAGLSYWMFSTIGPGVRPAVDVVSNWLWERAALPNSQRTAYPG